MSSFSTEGLMQRMRLSEFGWGGDGMPADQPQYQEDHPEDKPILHDEPDYEPGSDNHVFFYGNGQLHVAPEGTFTHDDLRGHAGVGQDYTGPMAAGRVSVDHGRATWGTSGNVGIRSLHRILSDYTKNVGWRWHGLTDMDGQPYSDDFAPKKSMMLVDNENGDRFHYRVAGKTAYLGEGDWTPEQEDALRMYGFKIAEYPGGGTMTDRMHYNGPGGETLETNDLGAMSPTGPTDLSDEGQPHGTFKCPSCSQIFPNWQRYMDHRAKEEPMGDEDPMSDSKFPPLPNMDLTLVPKYHDNNSVVMPLASVKEAARHEDWNEFINAKGRLYGAYRAGELRGVAVVQAERGSSARISFIAGNGSVQHDLISRIQQHYPAIEAETTTLSADVSERARMARVSANLYRWAAGQDPKDMIASPVPFVFDVQGDHISVGQPGERHSDIEDSIKFTPGGIVEGTYEPGGNVVLHNRTTMPYTVRHLIDLWYWTHPHMEVTGVEREADDGTIQKLASERTSAEVGSYVKTIAATDPAVWNAFQALAREGGKVYAVGGVVRDALMNKQPKDVDLMVGGLPSAVVQHTLNKLPGRVDLTGKSFGVYRYNFKGHEVEIALPRTETSTGDRRKDFDVKVDHKLPVEDDLLRRDFTVNSMAVDMSTGKLIDPFGGAKDLKESRLRTTHPSSFVEDPTRILRGLVMNGRYGLVPDEETRHEMIKHKGQLDHESWDNMNGILEKVMESHDPARAMRLAQDTGVMAHIFPEIHNNFEYDQNNPHHNHTLGDHLLNVLDNTSQVSKDPDLRMAALLHDIGKPASAWVDPVTGTNHYYHGKDGQGGDHEVIGAQMANNRLLAIKWGSKARRDRITNLINNHMWPVFSSSKGARKFLHRVGDENADDLMTLRWADQRGKGQTPEELDARTYIDTQRGLVEQARSAQAPTSQSALAINGSDILALGVPAGPQVGTVLRHLTDDVVDDPALNTPEQLRERAQEYVNGLPS